MVKAARGRNLFFSTDVTKHVGEADIVFVRWGRAPAQGDNSGSGPGSARCAQAELQPAAEQWLHCIAGTHCSHCLPPLRRRVNTPTKTQGVGAGNAADLT